MTAHSSILAWRIPLPPTTDSSIRQPRLLPLPRGEAFAVQTDRGASWAAVHGVTESDTTEAT